MIFLYVICGISVMECFYCSLMKRRSSKDSAKPAEKNDKNTEKIDSKAEKNSSNKLLHFLLSYADAFTFLYFKLVGYIPSHIIRKIIYKIIFRMTIERNVVIYYGLETRCPWNIRIGEGSIVGDKVILDARNKIIIGKNVNISTGSWMWTLQHDIDSPSFSSHGTGKEIVIEDRAWISSRTTILPGCYISKGVVVAAGAVVTRPINDKYTVWGGVPAKKIGDRNQDLSYSFQGQHRWFI